MKEQVQKRQVIRIYWQAECEEKLPTVMETIRRNFQDLEPVRGEERKPGEECYDYSRYQYDAAGLLRELPDEDMDLYVVHADLYYPGYRYLYGAATKRKAVVSDFRPDTLEGFLKEVCHEIGHALGLKHCTKNCVMKVSRSERRLQKKSMEFCGHCQKQMAALLAAQRIDNEKGI